MRKKLLEICYTNMSEFVRLRPNIEQKPIPSMLRLIVSTLLVLLQNYQLIRDQNHYIGNSKSVYAKHLTMYSIYKRWFYYRPYY